MTESRRRKWLGGAALPGYRAGVWGDAEAKDSDGTELEGHGAGRSPQVNGYDKTTNSEISSERNFIAAQLTPGTPSANLDGVQAAQVDIDVAALDRARRKAYARLIPLLFASYVIAYVDRANVAFAKLTMSKDMPAFDNEVIGFGAGMFFLGYFLLEIPGTIIVERWSARKWISRIMITWGIVASLTAMVKTPAQFYVVRFFLGLCEAGFFPGVLVFLTHWFPQRDRARAIAYIMIASPVAMMLSPLVCNQLVKIGISEVVGGVTVLHPLVLGLKGWQWIYIAWGLPAVPLGVLVLLFLTDRPGQAKWLSDEERTALETTLAREKAIRAQRGNNMKLGQALRDKRVLLLAFAYFCGVTTSYGTEFFLPSILERWYHLDLNTLAVVLMLPPLGGLLGQLFVSWRSDRTKERRFHAIVPMTVAAISIALAPFSLGLLPVTLGLYILATSGMKGYQPPFWAMPSLFLTETAAAGCVGLINSVGNLGGFLGPVVVGTIDKRLGGFQGGMWFLAATMTIMIVVIFSLGLGKREETQDAPRSAA